MSVPRRSSSYHSVPDPTLVSFGLDSVRHPPAYTRGDDAPVDRTSRPPGPPGPINQFGFPLPGEQSPSPDIIMNKYYFTGEAQWQEILNHGRFDDVVCGSGFCALAYIDKALELDPRSRAWRFLAPDTLPGAYIIVNLSLPFKLLANSSSEIYPWALTSKTFRNDLQFVHGLFPFFGGRSPFWSSWSPRPPLKLLRDFPESLKTTTKRRDFWKESARLLKVVKPVTLVNKEYRVLQPYIEDQFKGAGVRTLGDFKKEQDEGRAREGKKAIASADYGEAASLAVGRATGISEIVFEKFSTPGPLLKIYERQRELAKVGEGSPLTIATNTVVERFDLDPQDKRVTVLHTSRGPLCFPGDKKTNIILATGAIPACTIVLNSVEEQRSRAGSRLTGHFLTQIVARFPLPSSLKSFKEEGAKRLAELEIKLRKEQGRRGGGSQDEIEHRERDALRLAAYYLAGRSESGLQYHADITVVHSPSPSKQQEDVMRLCPDFFAAPSEAQLKDSEGHIVVACVMLGEISEDNNDCHIELDTTSRNLTTNIRAQVVMSEKEIALRRVIHQVTKEAIGVMAGRENRGKVQYWHASDRSDGTGEWTGLLPNEIEFQMTGVVHESSTLYMDDGLPTDPRSEGTKKAILAAEIAELEAKVAQSEDAEKAKLEDAKNTKLATAHASVDRNYRVYGTGNVYVTGSAIFPTAGSWNPTRLMCGFVRDLARKLYRPDVFQQVFALSLASNLIRRMMEGRKDPRGWLKGVLRKLDTEWELAQGPVVSDGAVWYIAHHPSFEFEDGSIHPTYVIAISDVLPSEGTGDCLPADFGAWLNGKFNVVPEDRCVDGDKAYIKITTARAAHRVLTIALQDHKSGGKNTLAFIQNHRSRSTRFVITGHSAGGAVAATLALALVHARESAVVSPHRILTYPTAAPSFGNLHFVDLFHKKFQPRNLGGTDSYKGWNVNLVNRLDIVPQVRCALGCESLKQIFRDNPTFYDEPPPCGGDLIFKPPPPSPSNVDYKPLPSQYITGPRPRVPPKLLSKYLEVANDQHVQAYIKVIWDYPRSEKCRVLSTEVTGKEAASKTEFDFPLSDSYPDRVAGCGKAWN